MPSDFISPATPTIKKLSRIFCVAVILIAILVFVGWITGTEKLKRLIPDAIAVNPLTALCFLLCGIALWFRRDANTSEKQQKYSVKFAWFVLLVGLAKFFSFIFSVDIYIDSILFHDQLFEPARNEMNRMAPNTALCFFLAGLSLLWIDKDWMGSKRPAQYFSIIIAFIALLSIYGYIYGVKFLYGISHYIPMSVITSINFLLLSFAILFARPEKGTMAVIIGDTSAEVTLLRLAAFIIPLIMGWLKLKGERLGYFSTEFGTALFAIATYSLAMFLLARRSVVNYRMRLVKSQAAEEMKRAHKQFFQFFHLSPEIKVITSLSNGRTMFVNKAYEDFFGISADKAVGKTSLELNNVSRAQRRDLITKVTQTGIARGYETTFINARGETRNVYIDTAIIDLDEQKCLLTNVLDITSRKKAEEALRHKEQLLRSIVDNIGEGLVVVSPEGDYLVLNQKAKDIIKDSPTHVTVDKISERFGLFYPDKITPLPPEESSITRSLKGLNTDDLEFFIRNPNVPEGKFLVSTGRPIRDLNGKIIAAVTVFRDDTRRRQLEALLYNSEQQLKEVMSSVGEGVVICNNQGKFLLFNRKAQEIMGESETDLPPEQWPEKYHLHHPDGRRVEKDDILIIRALKGETIDNTEVLIKNPKSGSDKIILVSARPVRGEDNEIVAAVANFRDITEVKRLEQLLVDIRLKYNELIVRKHR